MNATARTSNARQDTATFDERTNPPPLPEPSWGDDSALARAGVIPFAPRAIPGPAAPEPVDWPEPQPFPDALPPVPVLNERLLPRSLRAWAADIAERMACPLDYVGVPAMVAAGSLIGRRVGIRPQAETDWTEAGNLWGLIVGEPGTLKSPAVREALAPLRRMEARAAEAFALADIDHAIACNLHKVEQGLAEAAARAATKAGNREAARAAFADVDEVSPPKWQRFITSDSTAEKLGELLKDNPNGLLVERDEALALFRDLDKEERASARGFYMSGWAGMSGYTFDRIGRGTTHIPAVTISFIGTVQPVRLGQYIAQSLRSNDDGMVQRLQLLAWPERIAFRDCDRLPNAEAKAKAWNCFDRLATLNADTAGACRDMFDDDAMPTLRFDPQALGLFREWRGGLEARLESGDYPAGFVAHLSKYRGLIPRLALVCHLAGGFGGPVGVEPLEQALSWAEYLEPHAARAYGAARMDEVDAARAIWRRLERGELESPFTARELTRKNWTGLDRERADAGLAELVELDRLRMERVDTGGRPLNLYTANPRAKGQ